MSWWSRLFKKPAFVRVERISDDGKKTIGKMFIDDKFVCYTLEDTHRDKKIKHETRIPAGRYKLALRHSPKFSPRYKHDLIWLQDVPGFQWILIHIGNTEKDTSGCILVGEGVIGNGISSSRKAYNKIYPMISTAIKSGRDCWIEIVNKGG